MPFQEKRRSHTPVHIATYPDRRGGGDKGTRGVGERLIFSSNKWFQEERINPLERKKRIVSETRSAWNYFGTEYLPQKIQA